MKYYLILLPKKIIILEIKDKKDKKDKKEDNIFYDFTNKKFNNKIDDDDESIYDKKCETKAVYFCMECLKPFCSDCILNYKLKNKKSNKNNMINVMKKDNDSEESESEKSENNINNDILNIKEVEEEEVSKGLTILGGFSQRNIIKDKVKSDNLVKEKKKPLDLTINQSVVLKKDISIDDPNEKYLTPQQVIDKVKEWVLNGCLIKFQMWLHRVVSNYNNISSKEKYLYERDIIKGKSQVSTMLENLIESELKTIELTQFTEREMKELKQYFDGSRKKRYEELVKKRAKLQKQRQKEKEKQEKLKLKNKFDEKKEKEKQDKEREKRDKERKERIAKRKNEKRVNIRDKKFLPIRTIAAKKIFEKYLSKTFIIGSIFKDVLSFFSNNFKWFCFFIMILNHIMSYSFISLFIVFLGGGFFAFSGSNSSPSITHLFNFSLK